MADKRLDDYKPLKFYQGKRPASADPTGFFNFSDEGLEYFAYQVDGKVMLISQAYKARAGRDNGIVSTRKNMAVEEQYVVKRHDNGKWFFDIVARNKQNVATSVWFASEKAAREHMDVLLGKRKSLPSAAKAAKAKTTAKKTTAKKAANAEQNYKPLAFYSERVTGVKDGFDTFEASKEDGGQHYFTYNRGGEIVLISEGYPTVAARKRGMDSVEVNMGDEARFKQRDVGNGQYDYSLRAKNNKEIARSVWYGSAAAATAGAAGFYAAKKARAANVEQNYKPLAFYEARIQGREDGFETFVEDGQHYFTYSNDGRIALISEGYPTAAARDTGMNSVRLNMTEESQYTYGDVGGGYQGYRLKAKNNKEIARSVGYGSAALAAAGAALLFAPKAKAAPVVVEPVPVEPEIVEEPVAPVVASGAAAGAGAAALAAGGLAAAATTPEPVAAAPVAAAPVAQTEIPVVHEEGGGFGWLKWLLLALGLAALLFFLLRFCGDDEVAGPVLVDCPDGSEARTLEACPGAVAARLEDEREAERLEAERLAAERAEAERLATLAEQERMMTCWDGSEVSDIADCPPEPPVEVVEPVVSDVTTAVTGSTAQAIRGDLRYTDTTGTCSCAASDANLFSTVGAQRAVVVTRLGTNPEFGNHQGQGAEAFFTTLQNRYASDAYDREYLDYLASSLGYSGFSAMDAGMFTETTAQRGSRVMLGYGSQHALQYSQLDLTSDADLSAFRVRSANGCDVNFMKTCGNFMYVCN